MQVCRGGTKFVWDAMVDIGATEDMEDSVLRGMRFTASRQAPPYGHNLRWHASHLGWGEGNETHK